MDASELSARPVSEVPAIADAVQSFLVAAVALPVDQLTKVELLAADVAGARDACIYLADYAQQELSPLGGRADGSVVAIDATILGRVFQFGEIYCGEQRVIAPLVDGRDRLGVVEFRYDREPLGSVALVESISRALLLVLVSSRRYTDLIQRTRRAQPLTTAAEMQWDLLPPLACGASGASIAGILEPAYATGGDSFDYAINGDVLEFMVIDAVGHGMPSVLKSIAAITTYRNVRREGGDLVAVYDEIGRVMVEQFGHCFYATGLIATLHMSTCQLTWVNAGHPQPVLVRDRSATSSLHCVPSLPMGLGGAVREIQTVSLQPADRLLVYTDGVIERRNQPASAHLEALTDLLVRATLDDVSTEETVRRLARSVLESCDGDLHDDATLVLVDVHGMPRPSQPAWLR